MASFEDLLASRSASGYAAFLGPPPNGWHDARECESEEFAGGAIALGPATEPTLRDIAAAWRAWDDSAAAFLAFPWCNAVGW